MSTMKKVVHDLAGASSPFDELIPALKGREHVLRLYRYQALEELNEDERQDAELFFDLTLELMTEKLAGAWEELNQTTTAIIKAVYDEEAAAQAYSG